MILLTVGSVQFNKDANKLVLEPIERMTEKVKLMASNPLGVIYEDIENTGVLGLVEKEERKDKKKKKGGENEEQYETEILENAINKIGQLLAVGFGEAGSQIITSNMGEEGDLNLKLSGQRVMAIFGFCDIRNFTDATEVLETQVMVFVN